MEFTWEPDPDVIDSFGDEWAKEDAETRHRSLALATSSLLLLTNNRVGTPPETVRPIGFRKDRCFGATVAVNNEIDLPGPVGYLASIKIDGQEQDLTSGYWRLDNGHILVWQGDGLSPIPLTQDLSKPDSEPGTWSVRYSRSYAIGYEGSVAVAYLAKEFLKAFRSRKGCSLPRGVASVTRMGVSFEVDTSMFPGGLTNIDSADQFILKWAPAGSPTRSAVVFDPRRAPLRRTSGLPLTPPNRIGL